MHNQDTIAAIATPTGRGGIGVVRLSGANAYTIATHLTRSKLTPRSADLHLLKTSSGDALDHAIVIFFQSPHSFTGEDVIEFQCHGSPVVLDQVIKASLALGARLASPGEFSLRAFLNGKMDLVQAEAVADLIHASSETAARMALKSLQGDFSKQIQALDQQLVHLRTWVEAMIDFSDEDIDALNIGQIKAQLVSLEQALIAICKQAKQGSLMREGISIVIAGPPNAGKSTLMNQLAGRDVAIVTDVAGTTRDVMREAIWMDGLPVTLIDTAGLRDTECPVEQEGIKRAWLAIETADCVLLVSDLATEGVCLDAEIAEKLAPGTGMIRVFNKIDRANKTPYEDEQGIYLAAKTGEGLDLLKRAIQALVGYQPVEGTFIARRRHLDALYRALALITQAKTQCAWELLAEELRLAHLALTEITGEFSSDDLLGEIFSTFCIGK